MNNRSQLRRWLLICLFALGVLEICYGFIVGPMGILAREGAMYSDLVANTNLDKGGRAAALGYHIRALKEHWHAVALFGIANILLGFLFLREGGSPAGQKTNSGTAPV